MSIVVDQLTSVYGAGTPFEVEALSDVSFTIADNEFVGIIGQTGSGKSTLIQHLNGLIRPWQGRVIVDGVDLSTTNNLRSIRQRVGLVFQYPEHQLFEETVFQDVAFGPKNLGLSEAEVKERVNESLLFVGLEPDMVSERSPFELSGGQMRRVAIAGVLAMRPRVLILDEPTAGLDPSARDEVLRELHALYQKRGMTVILVSHSMEEVARFATRLIVLRRGSVALDGTPREVFADTELLRSIGLDVPQVTELMQALRQKGIDLPNVALTVEEAKGFILDLWQRRNQA